MTGGFRGPVPKRTEDRVRTGIPDIPVEKLATDLPLASQPALNLPGVHELAQSWYESLAQSAQSVYYEASDWEAARICAFMMSHMLKSSKPSAEVYKAILAQFATLLVTEGDRRRVRLEVIRAANDSKLSADDLAIERVMRGYQKMFEEAGA